MYTRLLMKDPTLDRFAHAHIFPNFLLQFSGDICSTFTVLEPMGPERTRYTMLSFVPNRIRWGLSDASLQNSFHAGVYARSRKFSAKTWSAGPRAS